MNSKKEQVSPRLNRLLKDLGTIPHIDKPKVLSLAISRIAAEYELDHNSAAASEAWIKNNAYIETLVEASPRQALLFADFLANYPSTINPVNEWNSRWLRGHGFYLLTNEQVSEKLIPYLLEKGEGWNLLRVLKNAMMMNFDGWNRKEVLTTPECFAKYAALASILQMAGNTDKRVLVELINQAILELNKTETKRILEFYRNYPEADEIVQVLDLYLTT